MATLKKLSKSTGQSQMGHNRRISPFDRADFAAWAKAQKLTPTERLAAQWLTDAAALRRNGQAEAAVQLERNAAELKKAMAATK